MNARTNTHQGFAKPSPVDAEGGAVVIGSALLDGPSEVGTEAGFANTPGTGRRKKQGNRLPAVGLSNSAKGGVEYTVVLKI